MQETRQKILRAAARCLATRGVRGLRMQDIKKEAGVSSGLLYYHFTDRDGLLAATLAYVNAAAADIRSTPAAAATSGRRRMLQNLVDELSDDLGVRENSIAWNEISASAVFDEKLAEHLARSTREWQRRVAADVRSAQTSGDISAGVDADRFAVVATALVDGLSERCLTGRLTSAEARDLLRTTLAILLNHSSTDGDSPADEAKGETP